MRKIEILMLAGIILSVFSVSVAIASAPEPEVKDLQPKAQLAYYTKQYGSSYNLVYSVVTCESSWIQTASGDNHKSNGVGQFHESTFYGMAKEMDLKLDYGSTHDQLQVMAWAFAKDESHRTQWTTYVAIKKGGKYVFTDKNGKTHTVLCNEIHP